MNVDHIRPRSRFPELALTESNLQVLCETCNHGKGNWSERDWRPAHTHKPGLASILAGVLLRPDLASTLKLPRPSGTDQRDALAALADYLAATGGPVSTADLLRHFVGTPHYDLLAHVLATAERLGMTEANAGEILVAGVRHWNAREAAVLLATPYEALTPEQRETLRCRLGSQSAADVLSGELLCVSVQTRARIHNATPR